MGQPSAIAKPVAFSIYAPWSKSVKETLKPGIRYEHKFTVPQSKTVPALYPESDEFAAMPAVFATGFLVGLLEWACIKAINPHLDWPQEQTVGTHIDVSHEAATPTGLEVTATVELIAVEGKKLVFALEANDGVDLISKGRHERFIIDKERFDAKLGAKRGKAKCRTATDLGIS
jgi:fluoroacetyl-CoA thioesterase